MLPSHSNSTSTTSIATLTQETAGATTNTSSTANTNTAGATQTHRPSLPQRHSSTSSHVSVSSHSSEHSSNAPGQRHHHHPVQHKVARHHGRLGAHRNTSFGHNLNKLTQLHHGHGSAAKLNMPNDGSAGPGHRSQPSTPTAAGGVQVTFATSSSSRPSGHGRSRSGDFTNTFNPTSPGTASPRPHVKRNASAFVVPRNHSHSALKKNYSSGHLPRNLSGKALNKTAQSQQHVAHTSHGHARAQPKRKHSGRSERSVPASPVSPPPATQQPTVRFALADDDGGDEDEDDDDEEDEENEWTEESASVSPNVTRDNTRNNSVVLDPGILAVREKERDAAESLTAHASDITSGEESSHTAIHDSERTAAPSQPQLQSQSQGQGQTRQSQAISQQEAAQSRRQETNTGASRINGESSYSATSRPPTLNADEITSRLLRRNAPAEISTGHGNGTATPEPQVSNVSAIVQPDSADHRTLSHSQASTLAASSGTPGRDLVSRFVNAGDSAEGTPRDENLLPRRKEGDGDLTPPSPEKSGELNMSKRNKSAPNMAAADRGPMSPVHTRASSRRSGTSTPSDLPPSRTQQKLLLQRASSALEPAKHIPAVLPRPGAAQLLGHGLSFAAADGGPGASAQLQALFSQISKEYSVVRRYRNPVADAASRAREIPRPKSRNGLTGNVAAGKQKQLRRENGSAGDGHESPEGSFRSSHVPSSSSVARQDHASSAASAARSRSHHEPSERDRKNAVKQEAQRGHKSRVSFDLPSVRSTEDSDEEAATLQGTPSRPGSLRREGRNEAYEICRRMWEIGYKSRHANKIDFAALDPVFRYATSGLQGAAQRDRSATVDSIAVYDGDWSERTRDRFSPPTTPMTCLPEGSGTPKARREYGKDSPLRFLQARDEEEQKEQRLGDRGRISVDESYQRRQRRRRE